MRSTSRMPRSPLPPNFTARGITITYVPGLAKFSLQLMAVVGFGSKSKMVKLAWNGMFPSESDGFFGTNPSNNRTYPFYEKGPRIIDIDLLAELAYMCRRNTDAKFVDEALVKKTNFFINIVREHHHVYFPGLTTDNIAKTAHISPVLADLVSSFQKFVRQFHHQQGFLLSTDELADRMEEQTIGSHPSKPKLTNARLLLILPHSCMYTNMDIDIDTFYTQPSTCTIAMAEIAVIGGGV